MDFLLEKFKTIREILFQGTFIRITAQYCKMKVRSEYIFIETLYIYFLPMKHRKWIKIIFKNNRSVNSFEDF